jgi:hypothetical protein
MQKGSKIDRVDFFGRNNAELLAEMSAGVGNPFAMLPEMGIFFFNHGQQRVGDLQ